jgi:hypothetical protein
MPVWSINRFISAMPAKGVTGLSEYSMGSFTTKVMLPHPSLRWPDKRSASLPAFYCTIWVNESADNPLESFRGTRAT